MNAIQFQVSINVFWRQWSGMGWGCMWLGGSVLYWMVPWSWDTWFSILFPPCLAAWPWKGQGLSLNLSSLSWTMQLRFSKVPSVWTGLRVPWGFNWTVFVSSFMIIRRLEELIVKESGCLEPQCGNGWQKDPHSFHAYLSLRLFSVLSCLSLSLSLSFSPACLLLPAPGSSSTHLDYWLEITK